MKSLDELKQEAEAAAEFRGHELGEWLDWSGDRKATAYCPRCGQWLQVETEPAPNSIDVGGPLVAIGCTPRQLAPYDVVDMSGELIVGEGEPVTPLVFRRVVDVAESLPPYNGSSILTHSQEPRQVFLRWHKNNQIMYIRILGESGIIYSPDYQEVQSV